MTQNTDSTQSQGLRPGSTGGAAVRRLGGWLGSALSAYAEYLAGIGWGRFFLLALLGLIAIAILESLLPRFGSSSGVVTSQAQARIKLGIREREDGGLSVEAKTVKHGKGPIAAAGGTAGGAAGAGDDPDPNAEDANIQIDKDGIRIESRGRAGRGETVVIDRSGFRVEHSVEKSLGESAPAGEALSDGRDARAAARQAAQQARVALAREIAQATESAINRELEGMTVQRVRKSGGRDVLVLLYLVFVFASAIIKVVGADRRRALVRAGAAEAEAEREVLRRQLLEARLQAMQAQVEPHFLFNTLASLEYLIETAPARASQMLQSLIRYLRAALPRMREQSTTLGREAELARAYLEILKFRMEERLSYRIDIAPGLASAQFPPMMLLSVVENAIKHGLEPKPEGGTLALDAAVVDGKLAVTVSDTGMGFGLSPTAGTGLGLSNLRERLHALYGDAGGFVIESNPAGGTVVRIQVPYATIASGPVVRETGDASDRNSRGAQA